MARKVVFTRNQRGIDKLMRGDKMGRLVSTKLNRAAQAARAAAPAGGFAPGYRESIRTVGPDLTRDGWEGELISTDIAAHLVEFGSINNPPYRPLTEGVKAAGLDFEES